MASQVIRYVNTDSTAGGNGTTNDTVGANRAYATLNEAINAEQKDISAATGSDEQYTFYCSGTAADTTAMASASWTNWVCSNGGSNFIEILANTGQAATAKWNTGIYRRVITNGAGLYLKDTSGIMNLRIRGLQINVVQTTGTTARNGIDGSLGGAGGLSGPSYLWIERCLILMERSGGTGAMRGVYFADAEWNTVRASNNVIAFNDTNTGTGFYRNVASGVVFRLYNNTIINGVTGFNTGTATGAATLYNNLVNGAVTSFHTGSGTLGGGYNSTTLGTATGQTGDRVSQTFTHVDTAGTIYTNDYHLAAGDGGALDFGTPLGGDGNYPITEDIDGVARAEPWDIGADEYVAAGGHKFAGKLFGKLAGKV